MVCLNHRLRSLLQNLPLLHLNRPCLYPVNQPSALSDVSSHELACQDVVDVAALRVSMAT